MCKLPRLVPEASFLDASTIAARATSVSAASYRIDGPQTGQFEVVVASLRPTAVSGTLGLVALRCLIVDDNETFLASASRLLSTQGVEVVGRALSGAEALELAEQLQPDVALVDIQLGREDALDLTRRLAAAAPSTRVILISSHPSDELGELIAENPATGFLSKSALGADAIAKLLGQRDSR